MAEQSGRQIDAGALPAAGATIPHYPPIAPWNLMPYRSPSDSSRLRHGIRD